MNKLIARAASFALATNGYHVAINHLLLLTKKTLRNLAETLLRSLPDVGDLAQQLVVINRKLDKLSYQNLTAKVRGEVGVLDDHIAKGHGLYVPSIGTSFFSNKLTPAHKKFLSIAQLKTLEVIVRLRAKIEKCFKAFEQALIKANRSSKKEQIF